VTTGQGRRTARRTRGFGVHPHEVDAVGSEAVDVRRFKTPHFLDRGNTYLANCRIVPHDMDDVGRRTVLLTKLRQLAVNVLIFGSPLRAVLGR